MIFDSQSPHGSRRYIANLAGDDDAVLRFEDFETSSGDEVPDMFERKDRGFERR